MSLKKIARLVVVLQIIFLLSFILIVFEITGKEHIYAQNYNLIFHIINGSNILVSLIIWSKSYEEKKLIVNIGRFIFIFIVPVFGTLIVNMRYCEFLELDNPFAKELYFFSKLFGW